MAVIFFPIKYNLWIYVNVNNIRICDENRDLSVKN